jgi:hypothetical protein
MYGLNFFPIDTCWAIYGKNNHLYTTWSGRIGRSNPSLSHDGRDGTNGQLYNHKVHIPSSILFPKLSLTSCDSNL